MAIAELSPIEIAWCELNAVQLAALHRLLRVKLFACMMPRQVGKTHLGIWMIRQVMRQDTNAMSMFLAKDYPSIQRNTQDKFLKLFPGEEFNVNSRGVSHHNPSQESQRGACYLSGVDKNPHKIRGGTMSLVHWSEVAFSQFQKGESFKTIHQTVVLPMISRTDGYYFMESTPHGSNFWKEFWEDDDDMGKGFTKVVFPLEMCIALGAITRRQADAMESAMHPDVFKQEMLCMFVSFTGKLYSEYDPSRHHAYIEPEAHERVILGIDIGHTAGFSCLFGLWRGKNFYVFDQIYQKGLRIGQMVDLIEKRMEQWKIPRDRYTSYTDHDPEMLAELQQRRIKVDLADKLDPFACRMAIKEGLHFGTIQLNPLRCQELDKEFDAATWSTTRADEMDERGDPNGGHWDSEASMRYIYRGSKVQLERPEEMPDAVAKSEDAATEWQLGQKRREVKKSKSGKSQEFEY